MMRMSRDYTVEPGDGGIYNDLLTRCLQDHLHSPTRVLPTCCKTMEMLPGKHHGALQDLPVLPNMAICSLPHSTQPPRRALC